MIGTQFFIGVYGMRRFSMPYWLRAVLSVAFSVSLIVFVTVAKPRVYFCLHNEQRQIVDYKADWVGTGKWPVYKPIYGCK